MSADSFPARIEKGMRAKKMIHDFDDFQAVVAKYRKPDRWRIMIFHSYENGHTNCTYRTEADCAWGMF